jgi:hypothetical protein
MSTFKCELHKNVKKIKLDDYIVRYAWKKKSFQRYCILPYTKIKRKIILKNLNLMCP